MLMIAATQRTATQLPVDALSTLASGTSSEAVPLAVYRKPLLAAAYFEPKVSPLTAGKIAKISPQHRKIIGAKDHEAERSVAELHQAQDRDALTREYQQHGVLAAKLVGDPAGQRPGETIAQVVQHQDQGQQRHGRAENVHRQRRNAVVLGDRCDLRSGHEAAGGDQHEADVEQPEYRRLQHLLRRVVVPGQGIGLVAGRCGEQP